MGAVYRRRIARARSVHAPIRVAPALARVYNAPSRESRAVHSPPPPLPSTSPVTPATPSDPPTVQGGWRAIFGLSLLLSAAALTVGLGATGLWEPWEMDRADLARTLVEPGQISVALGLEGEERLQGAVAAAAAEVGLVPRYAAAPRRGGKGVAASARKLMLGEMERAARDSVTCCCAPGAIWLAR